MGERTMIKFEAEQTIARSAGDVWAYAADILRHPEWMDVTASRVVKGGGTEVGARALERLKLGPRSVDVPFEVSGSVPARRIAWRSADGSPLAFDVSLELEALAPELTRAVMSGRIGLTGLLRFIEPLMASEIRAGEAAELARLKANLEAAPMAGQATA
jgi:uncharacterized membrane protein